MENGARKMENGAGKMENGAGKTGSAGKLNVQILRHRTHSQKEHCQSRAYLWQYGCINALYLTCTPMLMDGICVGIVLAILCAIRVTF